MKTEVGIDIEKNLEEEYMKEVNECADKCHEPEGHDEFAWDPARVPLAREADMMYCQKMQVYSKVPVQKCNDVTGKMPINVQTRTTAVGSL